MARADFLPRQPDPMRDLEWCAKWQRYVTALEMVERNMVIRGGTPYEKGQDRLWREAENDNRTPRGCGSPILVR